MSDNKVTEALTEEIELIDAAIVDLTERKERAIRFLTEWNLDVKIPFTIDTTLGKGTTTRMPYLPVLKAKPGPKPNLPILKAKSSPKHKAGPKAAKPKVVATHKLVSMNAILSKDVIQRREVDDRDQGQGGRGRHQTGPEREGPPVPKAKSAPGRKASSKTLSILKGVADVFASDPSNPRTTKAIFESLEARGIHVGTQNPKNTLAAILSKNQKYRSSGAAGWTVSKG